MNTLSGSSRRAALVAVFAVAAAALAFLPRAATHRTAEGPIGQPWVSMTPTADSIAGADPHSRTWA